MVVDLIICNECNNTGYSNDESLVYCTCDIGTFYNDSDDSSIEINNDIIDKLSIYFSLEVADYAFLSNFYPINIVIDGKRYYHIEGYYQSAKHQGINNNHAEYIRMFRDPGTCKVIGQSIDMTTERLNLWENGYKVEVMKRALLAKFTQHKDLAIKLVETKPSILVEYNPWNEYWGSGKYGKGYNMLGKLLMEIRDVII